MMKTTLDLRAIEDLVSRIEAQVSRPSGRVIGFIASGKGEGTSSLAQAYAEGVVCRLRRRVLLLSALVAGDNTTCVLAALAAGTTLDESLHSEPAGYQRASFGGESDTNALWELLSRPELWAELRQRFDEIVLDLPTTAVSRIGLVCAAQCDGVVVVVEAEKTRAPVVENLLASLRAVHAPLLGTVLNKRRYYLPQRVYRWL